MVRLARRDRTRLFGVGPMVLALMILGLTALGLMVLSLADTAAHASPVPPRAVLDEPASSPVRRITNWIIASADNGGLPFIVVDKVGARVLVFDPAGRLEAASPALLGLARGDDSAPGIGQRKLMDIHPKERTTPAGRFVAHLGADLGEKNVLWVDYDAAISLHRVITGDRHDHRLQRLATPSPLDNRISYGCINVPVNFFETSVEPAFAVAGGVVYILPEIKSLKDVFPGF